MSESLILLDQKLKKQHDGAAMGYPLGPALANVFLCYLEKTWLQNCPSEFKPVIYRRYVVDAFLLFRSKRHIEKFQNYLNRQYKNIRFTSETENENSTSFPDIKVSRDNDKFTTSVYHKPAFSGVFTNFESFIRSHIITTSCLPYCTGHSNFVQILNFFIKKLRSERLVLKITVIPKVLLMSVVKSS